MAETKIFLLKIFVHYFGCLGLSLCELKWKNWPRMSFTLALHALFVYSFLLMHRYVRTSFPLTRVSQVSRNAFGLMVDYSREPLFFFSFFLCSAYYLVCGRKLVKILDCSSFMAIYPLDIRWRYWAYLAGINLYSVGRYFVYRVLADQYRFPPTATNVLIFFTLCVFGMVQFLTYMIIHYFKHATYELLHRCLHGLRCRQLNRFQALQTVRSLTEINCRFHAVVGFLLIILVTRVSGYSIMTLFRIHQGESTVGQIVVLSVEHVYMWYLCRLDANIQKTLAELLRHLDCYRAQEMTKVNGSSRPPACITAAMNRVADRCTRENVDHLRKTLDRYFSGRPTESEEVKRTEMFDIYREYFMLTIYDVCRLDTGFLLKNLSFIISLFVLIIQTD